MAAFDVDSTIAMDDDQSVAKRKTWLSECQDVTRSVLLPPVANHDSPDIRGLERDRYSRDDCE